MEVFCLACALMVVGIGVGLLMRWFAGEQAAEQELRRIRALLQQRVASANPSTPVPADAESADLQLSAPPAHAHFS